MKQTVIVIVVLVVLVLAFFMYDKSKKAKETESENLAENFKKNIEIKENESSIKYRVSQYWDLSKSDQRKLWSDAFKRCPKLKAVVTKQMEKWNRDFNTQLALEIDFYMNKKGRNPKDYIGNCE